MQLEVAVIDAFALDNSRAYDILGVEDMLGSYSRGEFDAEVYIEENTALQKALIEPMGAATLKVAERIADPSSEEFPVARAVMGGGAGALRAGSGCDCGTDNVFLQLIASVINRVLGLLPDSCSDDEDPPPPASTLNLSNSMTIPNPLNVGTSVPVYGTISSNYNITNVTAQIKSGSTVKYSATYNPSTPNIKTYSMLNMDNYLLFSQLPAGSYTFTVKATDASGETKTWNWGSGFTVSAAGTWAYYQAPATSSYSINCYLYSINERTIPNSQVDGLTSNYGDSVETIRSRVKTDLEIGRSRTYRSLSNRSSSINSDEFRVAMRVGDGYHYYVGYGYYYYTDYHFWVQNSSAEWADKHGWYADSIKEGYLNPSTADNKWYWTDDGNTFYYTSNTLYFAATQ